MKIFLTGAPRSGKSTLLKKIVSEVQNKQGFVTEEVKHGEERIGFDIVIASGDRATLARIDPKTDYVVSKYSVDLRSFEVVLPEVYEISPDSLLYIDEVGQMQLFSSKFEKLVELYLNAGNTFIATVTQMYTSELIEKLRDYPEAHHFLITPENREEVERSMRELLLRSSL